MPEDKTVDNIPDRDAHTEDGSAPVTDNAGSSIFDNMTPEELKAAILEKEKSYKELHSKMGAQSAELGELRSFRKEVAGESKLADALSAVKALVAEKEKKTELDYEAFEAQILEEAQENPGLAMKKFMRATSSWSAQDKKALEDKYEAKFSEIISRFEQMAEVVETTTDDYKENKELIEKLRSKGMSVKDAKAFAKEIRNEIMTDAGRTPPPGGISPTRVIAPEKKQTKPWTQEDVERWKSNGETEDFIAAMKAKMERDANLTDEERDLF